MRNNPFKLLFYSIQKSIFSSIYLFMIYKEIDKIPWNNSRKKYLLIDP